MSWTTFSILAALIWSIVNIVDKYVLSKLVSRPIIPLIVLGFVGLITSIFVFVATGLQGLSSFNIFLALVAGVFYALMGFFYFQAVKVEEISKVAPLFYLSPFFILVIAGLTLGEVFPPIKYLGILLLIIGAILISMKSLSSFTFGKAFWLMILSSLSLAFSQVLTKHLLNFADFWTVFAYIRVGAFLALVPAIYLNFSELKAIYKESGAKVFEIMSFNESLNLVGVLFITLAATTGFVTLVNALSSIQPFFVLFFTVLLSIFLPSILKEEISKSTIFLKATSIGMMFVGALLVA